MNIDGVGVIDGRGGVPHDIDGGVGLVGQLEGARHVGVVSVQSDNARDQRFVGTVTRAGGGERAVQRESCGAGGGPEQLSGY